MLDQQATSSPPSLRCANSKSQKTENKTQLGQTGAIRHSRSFTRSLKYYDTLVIPRLFSTRIAAANCAIFR